MKNVVFIPLLLCLFAMQSTNAQDYLGNYVENYVGFKAGISIPNLTPGGSEKNPINTGYSSIVGPDFAVFFEKGISSGFSLSTQLEYIAQGAKKDGFQALPAPADLPFFPPGQTPTYLYADFNAKAEINYLMLSELAKFSFSLGSESPFSLYADAGPFGAFLLSAHQVTSGSSIIYADQQKQQPLPLVPPEQSFDRNTDIKDQLHKGNFGIAGDIGIAFNFTYSKIFLEGGGNYGLVAIQKGDANGKNHIGAATVRIGYAYGF